MQFPHDKHTIKKQPHFLIVVPKKSRFSKYSTCFVSLDQKTPVFFDSNIGSRVPESYADEWEDISQS